MTMNLSVILQISHANMLTGFLNLHSEEANKKKKYYADQNEIHECS